jgi:amidase
MLKRLGKAAGPLAGWAANVAPERARVEAAMAGFDVLLTPSMPCAPPPVGERDREPALVTTLKASQRVSFLNVWNLLGWPGITVPAGVDAQGLPLGILLTGRPGTERMLVQLAAQLERARPWSYPGQTR